MHGHKLRALSISNRDGKGGRGCSERSALQLRGSNELLLLRRILIQGNNRHKNGISMIKRLLETLLKQICVLLLLVPTFQISCFSDSISSKDSLEEEDGHHSSFFLHLEETKPHQKEQSAFTSSDQASYSVMRLINEHISQSDEAEQGKLQDPHWPYRDLHVSAASALVEQLKYQSSLNGFNSLSLHEKNNGGPETFELKSFPGNSVGPTLTNTEAPGEAAPPFSYVSQEALLDFSQQGINAEQSKHKSAAGTLHHKDFYSEAPPKSEYYLKETADNSPRDKTQDVTRKEKAELSGSINNLDKVSNFKSETQKSTNVRPSLHGSVSNIQCDAQKGSDGPDPELTGFIKGILKKPVKHKSGDPPHPSASGQLIFAKHVAMAIRDSVELARAKAKNVEAIGAVKKKLRWFDEVHLEKEAEEKFMRKQLKAKTSNPAAPQDQQLISKPSSGYHFTKEAWTDVGVQVNLPQERADEVMVHSSNGWTSGLKVPLRERSTRVGAGPVSSQTRKGTVMRPQYAAEVRHVAKAQGRFMVPRPPPRNNRPDKKPAFVTDAPSVHHNQEVVAGERDRIPSEGPFLPRTADAAGWYTTIPLPSAQPLSEACMGSVAHPQTRSSRRGAACTEKRLCLDSTPTDEEICQLWHGVRRALDTKDAKNTSQSQVLESGPAVRKPCLELSRPLHTSQLRTETEVVIVPRSGSSEGATRLHPADVHAGCPPEQNPPSVALDTAPTHSSGSVRRNRQQQQQQQQQQQELISISSEERRILLSLDRLNQQLLCGPFLFDVSQKYVMVMLAGDCG